MSDCRTYLFAIGAAEDRTAPLDGFDLPEQFEPVRAILAEGLVAFVSAYRGLAIEDVPQNELTGRLLLNQKVIEQLMSGGSLLPVRLGTVMDDDDAVTSLLRTSGQLLRTACAAHAGTVEIAIATTWDLSENLAQIALDPEVLAAKSAANAVPAEQRPEAVIGVGRLVEAMLHERRSHLESVVLEHLRPLASDVHLNELVSDELVCNIALLVDPVGVAGIDQALYRLDAELEGRYNFRRVGPLPPYSFATVYAHRIHPDEIERARVILGLPHAFDESAVQAQYRGLALERHPDVRTADPDAVRDFEDLTKARATLVTVCQHRGDRAFDPHAAVLFASIERSIGRD